MAEAPQIISIFHLSIALLPALVVVAILFRWTREGPGSVYGLSRMLGQLLIIGYFLTFIFQSNSAVVVLAVLVVMVTVASWISLRTMEDLAGKKPAVYFAALPAITLGGGISLLLISQLVLELKPFYSAQYLIPLAGMAFANAMNSVSIAGERYQAETSNGFDHSQARAVAIKAAMIPITNSLFAVGLVSFPGMMTGQILAGVDPLIAARYQIMVMCMLFSSAGLSAAIFLQLMERLRNRLVSK